MINFEQINSGFVFFFFQIVSKRLRLCFFQSDSLCHEMWRKVLQAQISQI